MKIEFEKNEEKILAVFYNYPTRIFHIRELARLTGLNPNTVLTALKELKRKNLIKQEKKKHIVELIANRTNEFRNSKRTFNLKRIYDSGIINFLIDKFSPEAICVMGSFSSGEDIEKSDIDIIVIGKEKESIGSLITFEEN